MMRRSFLLPSGQTRYLLAVELIVVPILFTAKKPWVIAVSVIIPIVVILIIILFVVWRCRGHGDEGGMLPYLSVFHIPLSDHLVDIMVPYLVQRLPRLYPTQGICTWGNL